MRLAIAVALAACRPSVTVQAPGKLDVRVTEMPARAGCYLPDPPHAPAFKELDFEEEDIWRRTSVSWLDYNALVTWTAELQSWAENVRTCLMDITDGGP